MPKHQEGGHGTAETPLHHLCPCKWRGSKGPSSKESAVCLKVLLTGLDGCLSAVT